MSTTIQQANITVMVTNLDVAIKFYTEILGFKLMNRFGEHWADIEAPGLTIGLHPTHKAVTRGDNLQIGLRVANIKTTMEDLINKGVQFQENKDDQVRLSFFNDPDGNLLYLVQTG